MYNWRIINNTYIYDGSIDGLFTIIYQCLKNKKIPKEVIFEAKYQDNLLELPIYINTDLKQSAKMCHLINKISRFALNNICVSFLSENEDKENIILKYTISLFKYGQKYVHMSNNNWVIALNRLSKRVFGEAHRLKGFLRFKKIKDNILYADIEPENNVIEFLAKHFKQRLKNELWLINDKKRNIAALYNKKEYIIVNSVELDLHKLIDNKDEENYQKLWKDYFHNISIEERKNLRCQMNFMPKKYWKYLIEMEGKKI